jgi:hypothetical protein
MLAEYRWCFPSKAKYSCASLIAHKYRKGKLKSTPEGGLKEHEIVVLEPDLIKLARRALGGDLCFFLVVH